MSDGNSSGERLASLLRLSQTVVLLVDIQRFEAWISVCMAKFVRLQGLDVEACAIGYLWRRGPAWNILVDIRLREIHAHFVFLVGSKGSELLGPNVVLTEALGAAGS